MNLDFHKWIGLLVIRKQVRNWERGERQWIAVLGKGVGVLGPCECRIELTGFERYGEFLD